MTRIVLVLGDQLSPQLSALRAADKASDIVLMAEVMGEATYVGHHPKKIALLFAAMRKFAGELVQAGWTVDYIRLNDTENSGSLIGEIERAMARHNAADVVSTLAGEWRVRDEIAQASDALPDDRFVATEEEFAKWAEGRKELRMEFFYRNMRRKTGLLMDGDRPIGGKWNFDADNRKAAAPDLFMPAPLRHPPDEITRDVLDLVTERFGDHFGDLEPFWFATDRNGAEAAATHFIEHALPKFGDYQDAMLSGEHFLYHSVVSIYLNIGLLEPLHLCAMAERAYHQGDAPLNAVEGFIRQIIGWREYIRGIYFWSGRDYTQSNFLGASRDLPGFYWTADTDMACVREAVSQTKSEAYAHHIQRLMVTGNFAMIAGVAPAHVHEWYLAVYADAFEWVEAPNVIGMSQFADGGVLASKPYASSGAYINRMSDYCGSCHYVVTDRTGEKACPFNALYWDFLDRNRPKLGKNQRLGLAYRNWDRMDGEDQDALRTKAAETLGALDRGDRI